MSADQPGVAALEGEQFGVGAAFGDPASATTRIRSAGSRENALARRPYARAASTMASALSPSLPNPASAALFRGLGFEMIARRARYE
ncbi:hypothetical protein AB0J35_32115 [Nonomuraea angiospora]|uniref:hypothetical protein n=1 Tax=Nonomuraea angiospora TaxID=46172 RepID=UPI003423340D